MRATSVLHFILILLLAGLVPVLSSTPHAAAQSGESGVDVVAAVNAYRVSQGKPALPADSSLMVAAQVQADWMATIHRGSHRGPNDSMPQDRANAAGYGGYVQENVAGGTLGFMTIALVIEHIWTPSTGHRLTMLMNATHIGAGVAADSENTYYALLIGDTTGSGGITLNATMMAIQGDSGTTSGGAANTAASTPEPTTYYVAPIIRATPDQYGTVIHTVGVGQTAWAIAAIYGVDLDEMLAINGLTRAVLLHPGDRLVITLGPDAVPPTHTPKTHVVQNGESAWGIAALYGITLDELLNANELVRPAILQPGDILIIPPPKPVATASPQP